MTRVMAVDAEAPAAAPLREAAAVLASGGLLAFPTESFYGLGADAFDPRALARIFEVKGRPESKPLLVLVDGLAMAESLVRAFPAPARELATRHWPGPLTLVLPAAAHLSERLTAGTGTIGIRMPGHAVALELVRTARRPVTAPSANVSGAPPPTTARGVCDYFGDALDLILDAGPTAGGAGSTIADCTVWPPRVLRRGAIEVGAS